MKYCIALVSCLFLLLATACNRQATRLTPAVTTGAAPAPPPAPEPPPPARTAEERAAQPSERRADALSKEEYGAPADTDEAGYLPSEAEVKAMRKEQVRRRRAGQPAPVPAPANTTARTENQASVGAAPVFRPDETNVDLTVAPVSTLVTFRKTNCYGDCETYEFAVTTDRALALDMKKGKRAPGTYTQQATVLDYGTLKRSVDSLRTIEFAAVYPDGEELPTDIPARVIQLPNKEGQLRTIRVYYDAPEPLRRLLDRLETLVDKQIWRREAE